MRTLTRVVLSKHKLFYELFCVLFEIFYMAAGNMAFTPFRLKFGAVSLCVQALFAILFAAIVSYDSSADPKLPKEADPAYRNDSSFEKTNRFLTSKYPGTS